MSKEQLIDLVLLRKEKLSNSGTKPTVTVIKQKAQDLWNFVNNSEAVEVGLIAIATPDSDLIDEFFKGWKTDNFERLALEIANVGNN